MSLNIGKVNKNDAYSYDSQPRLLFLNKQKKTSLHFEYLKL